MSACIKIAVGQLNLVVGDVNGNTLKIIDIARNARFHLGAHLVVFPELSITGYPPEDLLFRNGFHQQVVTALEQIKSQVKGIDVVVGYPELEAGQMYNSACVIRDGEIIANYRKRHLPNYSVFDEKRYFVAGDSVCVYESVIGSSKVKIGLTVCEDVWFTEPITQSAAAGAELVLNLNASPFHMDKPRERKSALTQRSIEASIPILYVNLVGGQDELVFDGGSFALDANGETCFNAPQFNEGVYLLSFCQTANGLLLESGELAKQLTELESIYQALVLGVRDYVDKNNFPGALLGLSGGIDSALTLAIAVDALGEERVEAVMMPSRYTSELSVEDAQKEAQNLGVKFCTLSIESAFQSLLDILKDEFKGTETDTTEENLQARCRGILLMALSNKKNEIVLTTGNKSEMAVGYATLYGDMAGGFNALKDVPKTLVYRLAEYRNSISPVIPQSVIHRAPSAELAPNQKDSDSLPEYGDLDGILELYVEQDKSVSEIVEIGGYDLATVKRVAKMVDRNEYKRRQAAPGVRISKRAFGRDRRYPITSRFKQ